MRTGFKMLASWAALASLATLAPLAAEAANFRDCDTFEANARNLAYPFEAATQVYADGAVSLIHLFVGEPACCGSHLMVLFPSDEGFLDCRLISHEDALGYSNIDLPSARASKATGQQLAITIPTEISRDDQIQNGLMEVVVDPTSGLLEARDR